MCEPRAVAVIALLWACGLSRAAGQNAADYRRRLDSLTRREAHADSLRQARRLMLLRLRAKPLDTARVGNLTLVANSGLRGRLTAIADSVWPAVDSTYSRSTTTLTGATFVMQFADQHDIIPMGPKDIGVAPPPGYSVAATLLRSVADYMQHRADAGFRDWVGTFYPPGVSQPRGELLYVELVTASWRRVQECYAGLRAGCRSAFGLEGADGVAQWSDAADRRRYVRGVDYDPASRYGRLRNRCLVQLDDDACSEAFREITRNDPPTPFSGTARLSLVQFSLALGGRGAYDRLVSGPGKPMGDRLADAALLPADSVIALWRSHILTFRPKTVSLTTRTAWTAVGWCLVLAAFALRSSKWR